MNRASLRCWDVLFKDCPHLLRDTWHGQRILRLYTNKEDLIKGFTLQKDVNREVAMLSSLEVVACCPALSGAVERRAIAGAVDVDGYGVDIIQLAENIRTQLETDGVCFRYAQLSSLPSPFAGVTIVTSGVSQDSLINGSAYHRHVQGVLGCWITLPNPGLTQALKLHALEPAGVLNFVPSIKGDVVFVSGGFGYSGKALPEMDDPRVEELFQVVEYATASLFPDALREAKRSRILDRRLCIRPMTPDGLPILYDDSDVIYCGGTSSGGATQAPLLARLTADLVDHSPSIITAVLNPMRITLSG
jgi:glycine/D-amino acid oxidase-like deaminating enzyme